ncbi:hypothetical protein [Mycobacterium sp. ITM-2016-00318]|uniref:hypothetical protein n=1 Tax=Mycobacterium sp. ITM-2016-00318 TaxID=2099693 RepID=UPI000CF90421|nr:hypothetical protein [Mycobacterium sp. ITM-2016-00318]WNG94472.1 hypothetical protein C6A82_008590 [Mycobacterium sp. ITM-2016-00318]
MAAESGVAAAVLARFLDAGITDQSSCTLNPAASALGELVLVNIGKKFHEINGVDHCSECLMTSTMSKSS